MTLAIGLGALVFKLTRTAVLAELDQDYVAFARSRGLSNQQIRRLVLRNAMLPIVTSLGLVFAFLFGGTILVEVTFALQGIGSLLAGSVTFKDVPVVQAITLLTAAVIALTALAVDLFSFAADPRVRRRAVVVRRLPLTPVLCAIPLVVIALFAIAGAWIAPDATKQDVAARRLAARD